MLDRGIYQCLQPGVPVYLLYERSGGERKSTGPEGTRGFWRRVRTVRSGDVRPALQAHLPQLRLPPRLLRSVDAGSFLILSCPVLRRARRAPSRTSPGPQRLRPSRPSPRGRTSRACLRRSLPQSRSDLSALRSRSGLCAGVPARCSLAAPPRGGGVGRGLRRPRASPPPTRPLSRSPREPHARQRRRATRLSLCSRINTRLRLVRICSAAFASRLL